MHAAHPFIRYIRSFFIFPAPPPPWKSCYLPRLQNDFLNAEAHGFPPRAVRTRKLRSGTFSRRIDLRKLEKVREGKLIQPLGDIQSEDWVRKVFSRADRTWKGTAEIIVEVANWIWSGAAGSKKNEKGTRWRLCHRSIVVWQLANLHLEIVLPTSYTDCTLFKEAPTLRKKWTPPPVIRDEKCDIEKNNIPGLSGTTALIFNLNLSLTDLLWMKS